MSKPPLEIAVRLLRPDEEEPDRLPLRWSTIARLLAFTRPHRLQRNTLLILCVFRAMALPGLAWLVGAIIKGPVQAGDGAATFRALALFTVFFVVADVALYWRIRLAHQIGENVLRDVRDRLMAHLLTQPLSFFHARRHGSLISRMVSDIEAMRNGVQNNFFIAFVSFGQMTCAAALMLLANPRLFLVLLAIVPCLLLVHAFFRGKILHASRVQQETFSRVTSALAETVQGIRVTQGFAREDTNAGIFTRLVRSLAGNVVKTASLTSLYLPLLELNAHGFMAALIGVGGWAALSGTGTGLGDLVTFFFLADLFFSPITIIGTQLSEATLAMAGAERYFRVLDTAPAWTDKPGATECPPPERTRRIPGRRLRLCPGSSGAARDLLHRPTGTGHRPRRPYRLREVDDHRPAGEVPAAAGGSGARRRSRPRRPAPGHAPLPDGLRLPAELPVRRHDRRQREGRPPRRDG